jgi:hypothetical protein
MKTNQDNIGYELGRDDSLTVFERDSNGDCLNVEFNYNPNLKEPYGIKITEVKNGDWTNGIYALGKNKVKEITAYQERVKKDTTSIEVLSLRESIDYFMNLRPRLQEMLKGINLPEWTLNHLIFSDKR